MMYAGARDASVSWAIDMHTVSPFSSKYARYVFLKYIWFDYFIFFCYLAVIFIFLPNKATTSPLLAKKTHKVCNNSKQRQMTTMEDNNNNMGKVIDKVWSRNFFFWPLTVYLSNIYASCQKKKRARFWPELNLTRTLWPGSVEVQVQVYVQKFWSGQTVPQTV